MRNNKGFTIMEVMLVVLIIGILIAVAVPAYNNFTGRARIAACQSNQRTLEGVAMVYYSTEGAHATSLSDLSAYLDNAANYTCPSGGTYSISEGEVTCSEAEHN